MRRTAVVIFVSCHLLLFALDSHALIIIDRWVDDLNTITGFGQNSDLRFAVVGPENYGEDNQVPYTSARSDSVYAVVDNDPGEPVRFFDKIIQLEEESGVWDFDFTVTNMSPYQWSDYHFEVWNSSFENMISDIMISASVNPFTPWPVVYWGGGKLVEWYDPNNCLDPQSCQDHGERRSYRLRFDLTAAHTLHNGTFGIRQIATTVPEPTTFTLIGIALAGLGFTRRKIRHKQNDR
jgi:hypothetical protein